MIESTANTQSLDNFTRQFIAGVRSAVIKETRNQSQLLTTHIIRTHLTGGTTSDRLAVRTGNLRRTTKAQKTRVTQSLISGGTQFGAKYAPTHVGDKGKVTTIKPKRSKFLTIPLEPALTPAGNHRFSSARAVSDLFFFKSQSGNFFLAKQTGKTAKSLKLFYKLVRQVRIKTRVHPRTIIKFYTPKFIQAMENKIRDFIKRTDA